MKKNTVNNLLLLSGIPWIFAAMISEYMRWGYGLGFALIALGIAMRLKDSTADDNEDTDQP